MTHYPRLILLLLLPALVQCQQVTEQRVWDHAVFPAPIGYINDFEDILSEGEENELEKMLTRYERSTTTEIVVMTTDSISPYHSMFDYSLDLGRYWRPGTLEDSNGILIVISRNLREMHIQNGLGIEERSTDFETKKIIKECFVPEFEQDNYFAGIRDGIESIILELDESRH